MTERRPLVVVNGKAVQLPPGDTLPGAGSSAQTGDMLVTARDPGTGWALQNTVYAQAAYPALFALVGLISDGPAGRNWDTFPAGPGITAAVNDACWVSGKIGIALTLNTIWRTTNGGASWTSTPTTSNPVRCVRVSDAVALVVGASGLVMRTADAGATWTTIPVGTTAALNAIAVMSSARILIFGATSVGRLSVDGGLTWSNFTSPNADIRVTAIFNSSTLVVFPSSGTAAYRSTDAGATWATLTIPSQSGRNSSAVFGGERGFLTTTGTATLNSADVGMTWVVGPVLTGTTGGNIFKTGDMSAVVVSASGTSVVTMDAALTFSAITGSLTTANHGIRFADATCVAVGNNVQYRSMPEYGYDSATQFKTPNISGLGQSLTGYVKT